MQEECRRQVDQITNEKKAADARIAELDAMLASKAKEYSDERGNLLEKIAEKEDRPRRSASRSMGRSDSGPRAGKSA